MKKKLMIIGAGRLQLPAIMQAKEQGCEVIAVDWDHEAEGFTYSDRALSLSTLDIDGVVQAAKKIKPDGVLTLATDLPVKTVAAVGEALGLKAVSTDTAAKVTDKGRMRQALLEKKVPVPRFFVVKDKEAFFGAVEAFSDVFIVKPTDSSGSRGVTLVCDKKEAEKAYDYSRRYSHSGRILVEAYLGGPEVSVETYSEAGTVHITAVTDKITTGPPHFVEMGHTIPSSLDKNQLFEIESLARQAVLALGIKEGPTHTEIISTPQGPMIVEVGARLGGDSIASHLVPAATGVNLVELSIKSALGEQVVMEKTKDQAAAIRFLKAPPGTILSLEGQAKALSLPGVSEVVFTKQIGEAVYPLRSSHDRVGHVIAWGKTARQAADICEKALSLLKVKTTGSDKMGSEPADEKEPSG